MSSPRKFSEKIALHNQKQKEETEAFEQIMNEVSKVARPQQKSHHLQLVPLGAYRGGSLPNVNQLNNSGIDLQPPMMVGANTFHVQKPVEAPNWPQPNCHTVHPINQNALHSLEDIKSSSVSGRSNLVERYRPPRGAATHRRHDTTPYTAPYLSPPSDTSWRRTNSDSALHTSAMNPGDSFQGATLSPRRDLLDTDTLKANAWDSKKSAAHNRPRSCEVPGINICPSEQTSTDIPTSAPIPISNNTGSLPDLTNLHIPSPLPTPLDPEDVPYNHGSAGNISPQSPAMLSTNHTGSPTQHSPQISPQISPQLQRRTVSNPGSPIAGAAADQRRQQYSPQLQKRAMSNPSSPIALSSNHWQQQHSPQPVNMDTTSIEQSQRQQQIMKVNMFQYQVQQQQQQQQQQQHQHQQQQQQQHQQQQHQQQQQQRHQNHDPVTIDITKVGVIQQQQYRDNHQSLVNTSCASPTSPASNPSYSPVASPGAPVGSPGQPGSPAAYTYAEYIQAQDTNALQQQFQGINMMQDTSVVVSQPGAVQYGAFYPYLDGQDLQITQQNKPPPAYPNIPLLNTTQAQTMGIPDIIFTGVGESPPRQDLPKEIGTAMAGVDVDSVNFVDSDAFFNEPIKLDPLDIDTLHMLTEDHMVADQATEESFRLDRL